MRLDQPPGVASNAHVNPNSHLYLNAVGRMSDADSLLTAPRNAKLFEAVMGDREIATRALRAADTSKFAGDLWRRWHSVDE